jgi:hypothetical protein
MPRGGAWIDPAVAITIVEHRRPTLVLAFLIVPMLLGLVRGLAQHHLAAVDRLQQRDGTEWCRPPAS